MDEKITSKQLMELVNICREAQNTYVGSEADERLIEAAREAMPRLLDEIYTLRRQVKLCIGILSHNKSERYGWRHPVVVSKLSEKILSKHQGNLPG